MRVRHKPTLTNAWLNEPGKEPMPPWVRTIAEKAAKPGTSFLLLQPDKERMLVPAGHYLIQGPSDVYPCDPKTFFQLYDVVDVAKKAPTEGDKQ